MYVFIYIRIRICSPPMDAYVNLYIYMFPKRQSDREKRKKSTDWREHVLTHGYAEMQTYKFADTHILRHTSVQCYTLQQNTLQNTLQHTATHCNTVLSWDDLRQIRSLCPYIAPHCNTLQNTLQHTATHCNNVLSWDDLRQIRSLYPCIVCARGSLLLCVLALYYMGAHGAFSMYFTTCVHMSAFSYKCSHQIP